MKRGREQPGAGFDPPRGGLLLPYPRAGPRQLSQLWAAKLKRPRKYRMSLPDYNPDPNPNPNPNLSPNPNPSPKPNSNPDEVNYKDKELVSLMRSRWGEVPG